MFAHSLLTMCAFVVLQGSGAFALEAHTHLRHALRKSRLRGGSSAADVPDQAATRTLLTLDANHDGRVDPSEVAAFAVSQGLDAKSATQEFAALDKNGDGMLDGSELSAALGSDTGSADADAQEQLRVPQDRPQVSVAAVPTQQMSEETRGALQAPAPPVQAPTFHADPLMEVASVPTHESAQQQQQQISQQQPMGSTQATESSAQSARPTGTVTPASVLSDAGVTAQRASGVAPSPESRAADLVLSSVGAPEGLSLSDAQMLEEVDRIVGTPKQSEALVSESVDANKAQTSANTIVEQLNLEEQEELEAQSLERSAAELRANSTVMARSAMQQAMDLGSRAANEKATMLLQKLMEVQEKAKNAEVEAAVLRAKSKAELKQADELMAVANAALTGAPV